MFVIREVVQCKPGKVRPMVEKFKVISHALEETGHEPMRLLTDVTGEPFWTIVAEVCRADYRMPCRFEQGDRERHVHRLVFDVQDFGHVRLPIDVRTWLGGSPR